MVSRSTLQAAGLGQVLALLIALTATSSTTLARQGNSFPTLQSALNYGLLALVYGIVIVVKIHRKQGGESTHERASLITRNRHLLKQLQSFWMFAVLAFLDVEANALVVLSYRYTSITSVMLLDCWSIPVTLALTRIFGLAKYRRGHYIGAALSVAALFLLIATDARFQNADSAPLHRPILGDFLVLFGSFIYSCSNVMQEHMLFDVSVEKILFGMGVFGFLLSCVQGLLFEMKSAMLAAWSLSSLATVGIYVLSMFGFYSLVPLQLSLGGAAMLNISLLGSDIWTGLARWLFLGGFSIVNAICFLFVLILLAGGIFLYSWSGNAKFIHPSSPTDSCSRNENAQDPGLNSDAEDMDTKSPLGYTLLEKHIQSNLSIDYLRDKSAVSQDNHIQLSSSPLYS